MNKYGTDISITFRLFSTRYRKRSHDHVGPFSAITALSSRCHGIMEMKVSKQPESNDYVQFSSERIAVLPIQMNRIKSQT